MKTTLDIPEHELREAIRHTGAKTKREAVVIAFCPSSTVGGGSRS